MRHLNDLEAISTDERMLLVDLLNGYINRLPLNPNTMDQLGLAKALLTKVNRFARKCDKCGRGMSDGYLFGGMETYHDECAFDTPEERAEFEANYDPEQCDGTEGYWTEWPLERDETHFTADGTEIPE